METEETMHLMASCDENENMELMNNNNNNNNNNDNNNNNKNLEEFSSVYEVSAEKNVTLTQAFFVLVGYNIGRRSRVF